MPEPAPLLTPADVIEAGDMIELSGNPNLATVATLLALVRRLDAFAAALAGIAEEMRSATSGGLLGLITGKR